MNGGLRSQPWYIIQNLLTLHDDIAARHMHTPGDAKDGRSSRCPSGRLPKRAQGYRSVPNAGLVLAGTLL